MKQDQFAKFAKYNGFCEKKRTSPATSSPLLDAHPADRRLGRLEAGQPQPGAGDHRAPIPNSFGQIVNLVYVDYVEYARVTDVCCTWITRRSKAVAASFPSGTSGGEPEVPPRSRSRCAGIQPSAGSGGRRRAWEGFFGLAQHLLWVVPLFAGYPPGLQGEPIWRWQGSRRLDETRVMPKTEIPVAGDELGQAAEPERT